MDNPSSYLYLGGEDNLVTVSSSRIKGRKHMEDFSSEGLFGVHLFGTNYMGKTPPNRMDSFHPKEGAVNLGSLPSKGIDRWVQFKVNGFFFYVIANRTEQTTSGICFTIQMGKKSKHREFEGLVHQALLKADSTEVFQHLPIPAHHFSNNYTWDAFVYLPDAYPRRFMVLESWINWLATNRSVPEARRILGLEQIVEEEVEEETKQGKKEQKGFLLF